MLPLLILVYLGGYPLMAAAFLVGAIGLHEFYHGFEAAGTEPIAWRSAIRRWSRCMR